MSGIVFKKMRQQTRKQISLIYTRITCIWTGIKMCKWRAFEKPGRGCKIEKKTAKNIYHVETGDMEAE